MTRLMLRGDNVVLVTTRMTKGEKFAHCLLSRQMVEVICLSAKTSNNGFAFPLYVRPFSSRETSLRTSPQDREPNLKPGFCKKLAHELGTKYTPDKHDNQIESFDPQVVLNYIVALLHSATYRERYCEFLSRDFPRIPLPGSLNLFRELAGLGAELVSLSVLESAKLDHFITAYLGPKNPEVGRVGWSDNTVWLDATATKKGQHATPGTIGFRGVPEVVWNFHIGGYQVCEKWLKDRKGRTLSKDDIAHYQKIVVALHETIRLMKEIDEVIEHYGGWPGAFQTEAVEPARDAAPAKIIPFRPHVVEPLPEERYINCVPLVPLKAAAGAFSDPQRVEDDGWEWVAVDTGRRLRQGMFVAQVIGKSMEPAIPDGAWCLFAAPVTGSRQGRTVLVQLRDASDPETGERYTVKRYESEKANAGDSWRHARIILKPANPDFEPIILTGTDEGQLQVVAEFVEVLGTSP
jgi:SOS-response transcriptional repressor LexA